MTRARGWVRGAPFRQLLEHPLPTLHARFAADLDALLDGLVRDGALPGGLERRGVTVEPPRDAAHGDLATNAAMVLAKPAGTNPRALAALIAPKLAALDHVIGVEVAGPGFLNVRLTEETWAAELATILAEGGDYGRADIGRGRRVNVEYVSANPTGPMHMGHCRGAVVGDALAGLLEYAGYAVTREYYVNDAGAQVQTLARSAWLRYREALGETIAIPEGLYPGDYLVPVGAALAAEFGDRFKDAPESEWLDLFRKRTVALMMERIRADLALLGIAHEVFASEAAVQEAGRVEAAFARLRADGLIYEGTLEPPKGELPDDWEPTEMTLFRATAFGDDQDRPVRKSDGGLTYFGTDLAYHAQKAEGADLLIDIWGADHAGTVKRIQAAVKALAPDKPFDVKLVQMVRLLRGGEPVKMSKRSGSFVTLADVVEEVGRDVVRFTMLTRRADAQMDFDFAKVVEASKDNPVFYVQYAHARIASLHRRADEAGIALPEADLALLDMDELALVKLAAQFPRIIEAAANAHEPHRIAFYLYDLAAAFHALWNQGNDDPARRFLIADDAPKTAARLALADGIGQVLRNGLGVMGVAAATEM
ncbi:arginine--tRNA ligase [Sphingomonas bacterium]|uniref:arginine--tRNA ligase n=1 Tax=Sphingomonas bacterium TaxID=1895847 RepID=UPI0015776CF4|nr:arginine--tRNA ligase [Sphingomonas bacterium]